MTTWALRRHLAPRHVVENDWTIDGVLRRVMDDELGEPLGRAPARRTRVMWWSGDLPE
jgi:hypothetical protein